MRKQPPTPEQRAYLALVKSLPCIIGNHECSGPGEAHHAFVKMGCQKDHDALISLCRRHHQRFGENGIAYHSTGKKVWEAKYGSEKELERKTRELAYHTRQKEKPDTLLGHPALVSILTLG